MRLKVFVIALVVIIASSCGGKEKKEDKVATPKEENNEVVDVDPMNDKGIGPITSITLAEIDETMAAEGNEIFKLKCSACHKFSKKFVGPALKGVTERRTPEWIMNMILNPEEMIQKNPIAKQLLIEANGAPMANQNLTEKEARLILEYFRTKK